MLRLHILGILLGNPIPAQYTVHTVEYSDKEGSLDLTMTNGGGPINTEELASHLSSFRIFGNVQVGNFGTKEIT
ncbi:MAG TPA: hypothetical protein VF974_05840 [Patescibacteria group bacterium]